MRMREYSGLIDELTAGSCAATRRPKPPQISPPNCRRLGRCIYWRFRTDWSVLAIMIKRTCSFALLVLGMLTLAACDRQGEAARKPSAPPPVPVVLRPAMVQEVQRAIEVVGTLWADEDVIISNKINGKVIGIYKDVGDRAEPGEPLAQLLRNDYELDRNQKLSALQEVLTKLGLKEVPGTDFDPSMLPTVRRAKFQADNAEAKYNRGKQLHDNNPPLISDQDFANLKTDWDVAKTAYDVEVLAARGLVSEARTRQAELAIAEQALRDTTITVPKSDYGAADATAK